MLRAILSFLVVLLIVAGCNSKSKEKKDVAALKQKLKEYRNQYEELGYKIRSLEEKIVSRDSSAANFQKKTLVSVMPLQHQKFQHYIQMQGNVSSNQNINLSSDRGGTVTDIYVEEGEEVSKGEVMIQLDDKTIRSNIEELQKNLELARKVYKRQKNLWEENIGSEVDYLQAKNKKENLEKKLKTARTRLEQMKVKAPIAGTIDEVIIKIGEMASPGRPLLRLVELKTVQVEANASEKYVGKIRKGDSVLVKFPSIEKKRMEVVSSVSQVINPNNRTFKVEITLDNPRKLLKPNMIASIRIADHKEEKAIVIPAKYIRYSDGNEYVFTAIKKDNGARIAKKVAVKRGKTYQGNTQILEGLESGDHLITSGYRDVVDGESLRIKEQVDNGKKLASE